MRLYRIISLVLAMTALVAVRAEAVIQGIDISHYQGTINWTSVKGAGMEFAFMKATESTYYTDPTFATNMTGAIAAGIPAGPYHFARLNDGETDTQDAIKEANYFVSKIKPYYLQYPGKMLRPVLDLENVPDDPVSPSVKSYTSKWVRDFNGRVKSLLGVAPIVYSNGNFATNYLDSDINQYPLWFAKPTSTNNFASAVAPTLANMGIWGSGRAAPGWKFWQWSWVGSISGISGNVDRDVYNGTLAELKQQYAVTIPEPAALTLGLIAAAVVAVRRERLPVRVRIA